MFVNKTKQKPLERVFFRNETNFETRLWWCFDAKKFFRFVEQTRAQMNALRKQRQNKIKKKKEKEEVHDDDLG